VGETFSPYDSQKAKNSKTNIKDKNHRERQGLSLCVAVSPFFNPSQILKASYIGLKTRDRHAIQENEARDDG